MMRDIFASDLDRTLIYSETAITQLETTPSKTATVIEYKNNKPLSVMGDHAIKLLQQIRNYLLFVPITTRTLQQFERIQLPFNHRYAVVANGAQILYNDKPLLEWEERIKREVPDKSGKKDELLSHLFHFKIQGRLREADGWFFYYVLMETLSDCQLAKIRLTAEGLGWRISLQGRKLYFMPNPISKGRALQYIVEKEGAQYLFGAGDSLLDYDFLQICDQSFVPAHGELVQHLKNSSHWLTKEKGMLATEEFLTKILQTVTNPEDQTGERSDLRQKIQSIQPL
ncbi:hypothetical protein H9655_03940 [Cytobacillus sp. Sa5YUA1]|uniref:Sucrose phosphatase-like domain-containing protein n=1 Tax=Cytobacillus stercorigallinarum TaxID=2762240 RepID=A0ABR8QKY4_9BACI|nr:HAD family hydrolase [Cytobacillus stercorigallinarum]MBD7936169.1 hypothetical protein [Cytobacillus stercorigallinarum]